MAVAKAIATPIKKHTAKTRTIEALDRCKAIHVDEGGTYLINMMRGALNAIQRAGDDFQEYEKTMVMAERLAVQVAAFITKNRSVISIATSNGNLS